MTRTARIVVRVNATELRELRWRAAAHRATVAGYLRALGVGTRPGPAKSRVADAWWDTLSPSRRNQVHSWLTKPPAEDTADPGQTAIEVP